MGQDQDQHHLIFLPGQADFHYQHMTHVVGTVRLGDVVYDLDGRGGKDHSWGPRNWHAKIYLRWLTCCIDDDNGFMLTRAVGPTAETRSGFVWVDRQFRVVDGFEMVNHLRRRAELRIAAHQRDGARRRCRLDGDGRASDTTFRCVTDSATKPARKPRCGSSSSPPNGSSPTAAGRPVISSITI